jgi:PAB-dependent poly(A)-specific ribonuclease subunit 3
MSLESNVSIVYGTRTTIYKAINSEDGMYYALRRIERCRLHEEEALNAVDVWRRLHHSNCVTLREAFTTKQFGDHSIVFVYDYFPCSKTLTEEHFNKAQVQPLPERILWGYICQLASAIATVHSFGLACRCIDATKIIITGKNRIRVNGLGVHDVLTYSPNSHANVSHYQQEDLLALGHLILSLAAGYPLRMGSATPDSISETVDSVSRHCSLEFKNILLYLLSKPSPMKHIHDIITMSANAFSRELNNSLLSIDHLENEFMKELENGRLVRLLCQLGFVNERPEFDMDPQWSETGDRYLLKLFRDYVFHQVDAQGSPVLDMAFVLQCLNKLDVGCAEKVVLTTRDELSCLIVSYSELKQCLLHTINDLFRKK